MTYILMVLSLVFVTPNNNPDYRVFVTKDRYQADLWVWKTESKHQAKDVEHIWFETKNKNEADFSVKFVDSKSKADLIIYYTKNKYEAGWKKKHRLKEILNDEVEEFGC